MKSNTKLSYREALKFGISSFIDNFGTFFIITLCALFLSAFLYAGLSLVDLIAKVFFKNVWVCSLPKMYVKLLGPVFCNPFLILLYTVGTIFLTFFISYQFLRFSIAIYNKQPLAWKNFFTLNLKTFFHYSCAKLLYIIKIFFGILLFIVPGVYFGITYVFAGYSLVDGTSTTVAQDTNKNALLTQGVKWRLLGFILITGILAALMSPLFFLSPILSLAYVHIYKQLETQSSTNFEKNEFRQELP